MITNPEELDKLRPGDILLTHNSGGKEIILLVQDILPLNIKVCPLDDESKWYYSSKNGLSHHLGRYADCPSMWCRERRGKS